MWVTTLDGMYSIADKAANREEDVCVRTRDEASLLRLRKRVVEFAKTNETGVYVKTGPEDGVMWHGRFWTGKRKAHAGTDYEWRMDIPRNLLSSYLSLCVEDLDYSNFKNACENKWYEVCDDASARRRMMTLTQMWVAWEGLWPRGFNSQEQQQRPVLTMIHGGAKDDSNTAGV